MNLNHMNLNNMDLHHMDMLKTCIKCHFPTRRKDSLLCAVCRDDRRLGLTKEETPPERYTWVASAHYNGTIIASGVANIGDTVELRDLPLGDYGIRCRREGYETHTTIITIKINNTSFIIMPEWEV